MSASLTQMFQRLLGDEPPLKRQERRQLKFYIKQRLRRMFPELAADPKALEEMYQAMTIEPRPGMGAGGTMAYEVVLPERIKI